MLLLKKTKALFFVFSGGVRLPHRKVSLIKGRTFHQTLCKSKLNFCIKFIFVSSTSKRSYGESKEGFESRWMSVNVVWYVKTVIVFL